MKNEVSVETAAMFIVAAVAAFGWIIMYIHRIEEDLSRKRHELRGDMQRLVVEMEVRMERRLARIERLSIGVSRDTESRREEYDGLE